MRVRPTLPRIRRKLIVEVICPTGEKSFDKEKNLLVRLTVV